MSTAEVSTIPLPSAQVAERIGQATAVEQARAVAEVAAAVRVAQEVPRSLTEARRQMVESCQQQRLAERAFFRFPRAGQTISGPSVHLAREVARCWGNIQYGINEMRRDDLAGQSEMQAWAWDVQTNARASHTFIVPHARDTQAGRKPLVDLRDIYENNANNGARRVREAIFAILPTWFTEEAQEVCRKTLAEGGGEPLPKRIGKAIDAFGGIGVKAEQIERKLRRKQDTWDAQDVASLLVIFQSIQRGEVQVGDEFPPERVTAQEIATQTRHKFAGDGDLCDECGDPVDAEAHS